MTLRIESGETQIRLIPSGEVDHEGAEALKSAVNVLPLSGKTAVVFYFSGVTYIGSAGLGKLLLFFKRLSSQKIEMRVEGASAAMQALLRELRLDTLFKIS
jgi:anti-anti-sigma factor